MNNKKAIFNWSGGKDSSLALYRILKENTFSIKTLLTSINQKYDRVSMHGVRVELHEKQAASIGLPLHKLLVPEMPSMEDYNQIMKETMSNFKKEGIDYSIFGDIFLEDLKKYREDQLSKVGIQGVFPLWKESTAELINEFLKLGFKAIIVCVNEKYLDKSFAGRLIDQDFLKDIPPNVDPCGENGEYHTFVFDGPIFKHPVLFDIGEVVYKKYEKSKNPDSDDCNTDNTVDYNTGFYYCDLVPR